MVRLKIRVKRLDSLINWWLDRILPKNLTARYLMGLGVVAVLAIVGQIFIQVSLTRQIEIQDHMRFLDSRLPTAENLRKSVLALELSSSPAEAKKYATLIRSLSDQLNAEELSHLTISEELQTRLRDAQQDIEKASGALLRSLPGSFKAKSAKRRSEVASRADQLSASAVEAASIIKSSILYLETGHRARIAHFKKVELTLSLLMLLVLALEALYVFRPAVQGLYEALRIRSDFLSRMSHEIRNPMNSIIGMANLLNETLVDEQQKRYLGIVRKSSRGLLDMLNNLLDFSSIEAGKLKLENTVFDLYEVIERALDIAVVGAHANGIELVLDLDKNVPLKVVSDPVRLYQVLTNLLGNAVKFTKKGHVLLQVKSERHEDSANISFSVIDTGSGIDNDKLRTIFDPFVQEDSSVRRRFGGTGLGLTISKQIVERMGGRLAVKSVKDAGSEFSFTLAVKLGNEYSVSKFISEHLPRKPFKIILVKKEGVVTETLKKLIIAAGGSYTQVLNRNQLMETLSPAEDRCVVVVDYEFVRLELNALLPMLVRKDFNSGKLVFLIKTTATANDLEMLGRIGIKNLLLKPIKPLQFYESLMMALNAPAAPKLAAPESVFPEADLFADIKVTPLNVLVVDDSHDNQMLIALYLENAPHRLVFADDGKVAVQKYKIGNFDLVFMDLQMPEMDGVSATIAIREWEEASNLKPVPIVSISAHDSSHESQRFRSAGFTSHLLKPIDAMTLRKIVRETAFRSSKAPARIPPRFHQPSLKTNADWGESDVLATRIERQIAKLVPNYLANRKKELAEMRKFAEAGDFASLETIGHRLKGNAKSYGFAPLSDIGRDLEIAAKDRDLEKTRFLIERAADFVSQASQSQSLS